MTQPAKLESTVSTIKDACRLFVSIVSKIDAVREVRLVQVPKEGPIILTLISAPAFERGYREPIYEAQLKVLRASEVPLVDFRMLNLTELSEEDKVVIPAKSELLWKSEHGQRRSPRKSS